MTPNAFNWRGPSQTRDKFGRIKTDRQMLLDANRVNPNTHTPTTQADRDRNAVIAGRGVFIGRNP